MFDNADEDKDLESQVSKTSTTADKDESAPDAPTAEPASAEPKTEDKKPTQDEPTAEAIKKD